MSRINEAMQRAGGSAPEPDGTSPHDEFVSGEAPSPPELETLDSPPEPTPVEVAPVRMPAGRSIARVQPAPMQLKSPDTANDIEIRHILRILLGRWRMIASVVAIFLGMGMVYNAFTTPVYEARVRLLIEPDSAQVVPFKAGSDDTNRYDYFGTQLDILRSRALARRTLERLGLLNPNPNVQQTQISEVTTSLVVAPARVDGTSRTVNLAVRSTDPKHAARLANGVAETYVAQNLELRTKGNREAATWLTERLGELRQEVTSTAGALQQYREQTNSVSLDDRQNIVVARLSQLSAQATSAGALKLEKQAVYEQLTALQERGAPLDTFPPIMSNAFIQSQKSQLAMLQQRRQQLTQEFGPRHPDMIKLEAEITAAEAKLAEETNKVVQSIRNDYNTAMAAEAELNKELREQQGAVLDLNRKAIAYGALERNATSTQQIFESVLQRLKEAELSAELQTNNVRVLDAALVPGRPVLPRTNLNLALALLLGFVVAIGMALAFEQLNPRITNADDVSEALGGPLLGVTPRVPALKKGRARFDALPTVFHEAIRGIRTQIMLSAAHADVRTLAVTSTMPKEGKTLIAASLAASIAMTGRRVLLVDADLRRAQVHNIFGSRTFPGLADVLAGDAKPSAALVESSVPGLFLMPAGEHSASKSDLLDTEAVRQLVEGLHRVFDVIVLDCPPVMALADATIVANAATSVLFVVGAGRTSAEAARTAIDRLAAVQAQVVGVVLNNAKVRQSAYGYSYYKVEGAA